MEPRRGRLLVGTPLLTDPNFARTVVLLLDHSADGAFGLILNRPSDTTVAEVLHQWAADAAEPGVVFVGGPVSPQGAVGLAHSLAVDPVDAFAPLFNGIGTVDLDSETVPGLDRFRLFAGYAGWSAGQLEAEIEEGSWFVVESEPEDAWTRRPHDLWQVVLRRQAGGLAMFAHCPVDPTTN
ncbi:MAG: YqgE/AlgH family protein [Acidimicrobiia bacterium]